MGTFLGVLAAILQLLFALAAVVLMIWWLVSRRTIRRDEEKPKTDPPTTTANAQAVLPDPENPLAPQPRPRNLDHAVRLRDSNIA